MVAAAQSEPREREMCNIGKQDTEHRPVVTPRGLAPGLVFGTRGLLPGGGGGAPLGFTELEMLCVVGLGLGDTLGEEF